MGHIMLNGTEYSIIGCKNCRASFIINSQYLDDIFNQYHVVLPQIKCLRICCNNPDLRFESTPNKYITEWQRFVYNKQLKQLNEERKNILSKLEINKFLLICVRDNLKRLDVKK